MKSIGGNKKYIKMKEDYYFRLLKKACNPFFKQEYLYWLIVYLIPEKKPNTVIVIRTFIN